MSVGPLLSLNTLPPGWRGKVMRLRSAGAARLKLVQQGLMPGVLVDKARTEAGGRGIVIRINFKEIRLTLREAESVLVEVVEEPPST